MNTNLPVKVSIIIPVYNAEKYLRQCIDSALNQTLKDVEVICVDDGSTDSSIDILNEYEAKYDNFTALYQKNLFAGTARNSGLAVAKGEYVAFLDSDDYYALDGIEKLYYLATSNNLDFVKCCSYVVDSITNEISVPNYYSNSAFSENQKGLIYTLNDAPRKLLIVADVPWNGLYKLSFLQSNDIRFNNLRCVNDHSFYINCLVHAERIMISDTFLTYYRVSQSNSLVGVRSRNFNCQLSSYNIVKGIIDFLEDSSLKQLILQKELYQIFTWYTKFKNSSSISYSLMQMVDDFIKSYDVSDVGNIFLNKFDFSYDFNYFLNRPKADFVIDKENFSPKISFIIPAYNASAYICECLDSLLEQTLTEIEIICVDDGSTDDTPNIIECYAQRDQRITLIRQRNMYAGAARNNGITHSRGEYIAFIDSDDKVEKTFAEDFYAEATRTNADVVVSPLFAWYGKKTRETMSFWLVNKYLPPNMPFSYVDIPEHILNFTPGGPGGKLFRRQFIQEKAISFPNFKRSEDFNFVLFAIACAERISVLKNAYYYYRQNNTASLESTKDETPTLFWDATMLFKSKLEQLPYFDMIKQSYLNNSLNRMFFNLTAINSAKSFECIFSKLKEVKDSELELSAHPQEYFYNFDNYEYIRVLASYDNCMDYLFEMARKKRNISNTPKEVAPTTNTNNKSSSEKEENKAQAELLQQQINCIVDSATYKIGRFITWLPRKVRGFFRCLKENGFKYTCGRILVHLHLKKDPYKKNK